MYTYDDIKLIIENARAIALLTPKEEKALARKIVKTRIDLWAHTLGYEPLCPWMIEFVKPMLIEIARRGSSAKKQKVDLSALNSLCENVQAGRMKNSYKMPAQKVSIAATVTANIDRGLEAFDKVNQELRKKGPFGRPTPPTNSQRFPKYLAQIDSRLLEHRKLKERFWRANIRLAVSLARKYDHGMIPLADIIQEGLIGLMTAVERFDPERGFRFSTYGSWWVRHAVNRFHANHGRTVRWPAHIVSDFEHLKQTRSKIINRGDRPTFENLAKESGIKLKRVRRILGLSTIQPISMDSELPGLEGASLAERLCDDKLSLDGESYLFDPVFAKIESKIETLPGIEGDIITKRFGLNGQNPRTLQEIAKEHDLSRERIRQLEKQGLERLREVVR